MNPARIETVHWAYPGSPVAARDARRRLAAQLQTWQVNAADAEPDVRRRSCQLPGLSVRQRRVTEQLRHPRTTVRTQARTQAAAICIRDRRAWLSSWKACAGYPGHVSAERDELRELVERLPDEEVPAVLSVARRHLGDPSGRAWPPAFFGAGRAGRTDVAERAEELLDEGFGQLA